MFTSSSNTLVAGDQRPFAADIFLKNFNGNGVIRAVPTASRTLNCLGMTPDANTVVYSADAPNGQVDYLGRSGTELAILVRNLATGQPTRVTPLLASLPNVSRFEFVGISDDGLRVAFIAQPTQHLQRSTTAPRSARRGPFVRDLATGALINLESQVRIPTSQGVADGNVRLSPDGRSLAFSSRADYPEAGDTNGLADVFAFDIASGSVRLVNTDAQGRRIDVPGFFGSGPMWGVQDFLVNGSQVAFSIDYDTSVGPAGVYVKTLATGALVRVLDRNVTYSVGHRAALSFSDDGRRVAYNESTGGGITAKSIPRVVDLATGARLNAATLTNGTVGNGNVTTGVLLSRDGRSAAFGNNSTNLLGGVSPLGGAELRAYRKLLP